MVGRAAVQEAIGGAGGVMITLERTSNDPYQSTTGTAPLAAVANAENCVPRAFINKDGNMPSEAFRDYALAADRRLAAARGPLCCAPR